MKKILFIYNPHSGNGRIANCLNTIFRQFNTIDCRITAAATKGPKEATEIAANEAAGFDEVICAGGDGTLSEVVAGLMKLDKPPALGYIPAGSTNDTRFTFNTSTDIRKATANAINGEQRAVDTGVMNGESFVYVASFGDVSSISAFTPQETKKVLGRGAYLIEGIKVLPKMNSYKMTVEFDGGSISGDFYLGMITNSKSVGGFAGITGKSADLADGLHEAILLSKPRSLADFQYQVGAVLINKNGEENDFIKVADTSDSEYRPVIRLKSSYFRITSAGPVQWVRDGENGGIHSEVEIFNKHNALTIVCGKGK